MRKAKPKPEQMEPAPQSFVMWDDAVKAIEINPDEILKEFMSRFDPNSDMPAHELFTFSDIRRVALAAETMRFWVRLAYEHSAVDPQARETCESGDKAVLAMQAMVVSLLAGKGLVRERTANDDTG